MISRDRLVGELTDLVEDRLAPTRVLGVDNDHAGGRHEHGRVATAAFEDEQVVFELLDFDDHGRRLRAGRLLIR